MRSKVDFLDRDGVLNSDVSVIVSVFAVRIADTVSDPLPFMQKCAETLSVKPMAKLLWASPRDSKKLQTSRVFLLFISSTK